MGMGEVMKKTISIFVLFIFATTLYAQFSIARVKYDGGGDWYTDPTALKNWLQMLKTELNMEVTKKERVITLKDKSFFQYPMLFMSGHGNIKLNETEVSNLREYLSSGGFLYINDDYGFDKNIRREMKKVFPEENFEELDFSHKIFNCYKKLEYYPKVHKHDKEKPQLYAIFKENRIAVLYSHEADIVDGLTDYEVFNDDKKDRREAMKFAVNMIVYIILHN
ncbi:MAG: DUF4159 domain-containing protein [Candidatus Mcinerneyibacterium aminivorans]|uniref:DUF4159 domain-containing protein n=1 Tax=Candidatus Mcinerneyibacterium aminivorans TaxID=2703815 RepID=A0A5D0MHY9_9BACT|nr:MAG: DUF4159 domain-containing protein [Candidatus Mcinerneyibacterium aminivorans]